MWIKNTIIVLCFFVTAILSGCASFPQNEVAKVTQMPDVSRYQNKPAIYIDFKFYQGLPDSGTAIEMPSFKTQFLPDLEKSVQNLGLFKSVTFDEFKKAGTDYTIKMLCYNHGNGGAAAISGFVTGFTFGVIPGAATDNYTLKVQLIDSNGTVVKELVNKDSVTTWIGLWFIPMMGNTPKEAVMTTLENQIKTALKSIIETGKLKYSINSYNYLRVNG